MRFLDGWEAALAARPDSPYLWQPGLTVHAAEAEAHIQLRAAALLAHGLQPGDTVGFYGRADADWFLMQAAVMRLAGVVAFIPYLIDEPLLARTLAACAPKYVLASSEADAERCVRCMKSVPELVQVIVEHGVIRNPSCVALPMLLKGGELLLRDKADELGKRRQLQTADDTAWISFSAGTMGLPRLVRIAHTRLERQVAAVAERLGPGPALYSQGRMDLIDHAVLLHAGIRAGRELVFQEPPAREWEWVGTADEIADSVFSLAWPIVAPAKLPRGVTRWLLNRKLSKQLTATYPLLRGAHFGFTVPPDAVRKQLDGAGLRVTWGYGLAEAHGFCAWEENQSGYGSVLPQSHLATHEGKLVFDWRDQPTQWWQGTGDWARTVGPWIADLEPHGIERGEPHARHTARKAEREICDHPWIASAFVSGPDPLSNLVLISLRSQPVFAWAREQGIAHGDWEALIVRPEVADPILARVRAIGHKYGLDVQPVILKRALSVAEGERTPRGEFRRAIVARHASNLITNPRPVH